MKPNPDPDRNSITWIDWVCLLFVALVAYATICVYRVELGPPRPAAIQDTSTLEDDL